LIDAEVEPHRGRSPARNGGRLTAAPHLRVGRPNPQDHGSRQEQGDREPRVRVRAVEGHDAARGSVGSGRRSNHTGSGTIKEVSGVGDAVPIEEG